HTDAAGNTGTATTTHAYGVDTTAPTLGITLDTIAGDNILNAAEANQSIPVSGQVSGEYASGDRVTLTVGNQTYTGSVKADGTFSINVPGSQLASTSSVSAVVSHTDAAGNTGSANTAGSYGVDTVAPSISISLNTVAGDDVINAAESRQNVTLSGTAGGDAVQGDTVTVSVGGQNYTTTVGANGVFSVAVPGSVLANAGTDSIRASVSHTDAAGNTGTATTTHAYGVDTTAPTLGITLDTIAGDNILNAAEANQPIPVSGRVSGEYASGDRVTLTVGNQTYTGSVKADGTFSINVPGSQLASHTSVSAVVSHTDAAGNTGSANTAGSYGVDTTAPTLGITLDTIAGDNILNAAEANQPIPVSGRVSGEYASGDRVTLTVGNQTYTGSVKADGTFSINVPGSQLASHTSVSAVVSHTDAAGNIGSANTAGSYGVDTVAPSVSISLNTVAGDDVINAAELRQNVTLSGTAGGDAVQGDTVTVSVGGQNYTTTVGANGVFSVAVPGSVLANAGTDSIRASVSHTDAAGNTGTATTTHAYGVDTTAPTLGITLDTIAGDNILNAAEAAQSIPVNGQVSGEYASGDRVTLTVGNQTYTGSVKADGTFSINVPGSQLASNSSVSAVVSHTDAAGNTGSANTAGSYGVDTVAPSISISLNTVAGDDVINTAEAKSNVSVSGIAGGDAVQGDTVTVSVGGQNYTTTVGANGVFSVAVPGSVLANAGTDSIRASVSHTDAAGNTGTATTTHVYGVDTTAPTAVADTGSTQQEQALSIDAAHGVLANDSDLGSDKSTLHVVAINGSSEGVGKSIAGSNGGTFIVQSDGSYRFLPGDTYNSLAAGEKTTSQISYTVSDGHGNVSVTTLTATIVGTNDVAIISGPAVGSVFEDSNVSGGKLATTGSLSVTDIDTGQSSFNPGSVTFTGASGTTSGVTSSLGSLSVTADGLWTFNADNNKVQYLAEGQVRTETFTVKSADGSASQTITINIIGTNDAPIVRADTGSTGENATLNVAAGQGVLANDSDVDGGILSVSAVNGVTGSVGQAITGSNGGTFTLNADGSYSFNPGSAFDRLA
ncbi:beta strand repeat-containing protein, partial [Salinicola sp. V024]|uniref:beta strand repeat-containing protein n=1 Tax=Salinicola sp. V024 TaxID=3459609 RepID=UPI004043F25C